jgi:HAD superfamily hydrolase (TIGR01509 family)
MNIIIPIGGKGERFKNAGYKDPKPMISIFGKPMICYVIDNILIRDNDIIFIIYYEIEGIDTIKEKYPFIRFIKINKQTMGATETIMLGLNQILQETCHKKTIIMDCDTFYTEDIIDLYDKCNKNAVFYIKNKEKNPIYSYIKIDEFTNQILEIQEKNKISDNANTGIYCFNDITVLYDFSNYVVNNNIMFRNENYISCIISEMIKNKNFSYEFIGIELNPDIVFNLGTPKQLCEYIEKTFLFLFDLDGTLVNTDEIYFDVWKELLNEYNIFLTSEIYKNNICGNCDTTVIETLLFDKNITNYNKISEKKDKLFIEKIDKIKLIPGSIEFLKNIKKLGYKIALVTNCNRCVSEYILNYLNINNIFEFIVIGEECTRAKPYPDPYIYAINKFNGKNNKTIIFEDSKTGLLSAKSVNPLCVVGLETNYSKDEIIDYGANISINNFTNININNLFERIYEYVNSNIMNNLYKYIQNSINLPIKNIDIKNTKLKGGFISDIIEVIIKIENDNLSYTRTTFIEEKNNCILKMENSENNCLSNMSKKIHLYDREYYFYDVISKHVNIKIPQFYGIIRDNNFKPIGILMENLNKQTGIFNLNLNNENINVSLTIIDEIAKLHSKFWDKPLHNIFPELKKHNNNVFSPFLNDFIQSKWPIFKEKWGNVLTTSQINLGETISINFLNIQNDLSKSPLTLCHGDVKSGNIFYKKNNENYIPYFLDWQYIAHGKGVQDLVFFMIESFDIDIIQKYKIIFKEYYYCKLLEYGVCYSKELFEQEFKTASYYFPFFVAIWFGTIPEDELIDKNFPITFIKKLFNFLL